MGWFRVHNGRLGYRGVTHVPFAYWLETARGNAAVTAVGSTIRFGLFGRKHAARRLLWRELQAAAGDERVQAVIADQARVYHTLLASLAFLDTLPKATVDLHRVVVVPRLLLNARAHQMMQERLALVLRASELRGGEALHDFFVTALVDEMDRAFVLARPTPRHPVPAHEQWASVAVDLHFIWDGPDWSGPTWPGHHYLYERPRRGLTRRQRKHLERAIGEVDALIARWPRAMRHETLQHAAARAVDRQLIVNGQQLTVNS